MLRRGLPAAASASATMPSPRLFETDDIQFVRCDNSAFVADFSIGLQHVLQENGGRLGQGVAGIYVAIVQSTTMPTFASLAITGISETSV